MPRVSGLASLTALLSLTMMSGCTSDTTQPADKSPAAAEPSTVLNRTNQLTKAAGSNKVSSIVTAPTATTARLVKNGKVMGWGIKDGEKPAPFAVRSYRPIATLPLDRIQVQSNQDASIKACGGSARVTTAVVATKHEVTAIQCGDSKTVERVLIDGQEAPRIQDPFSADGIEDALRTAQRVSPSTNPLSINLGGADAVSLVMPTMKLEKQNCYFPLIFVPNPKKDLIRLSPSVCATSKDAKIDALYRDRIPLNLQSLDAKKTSGAFQRASKRIGADLNKCSVAQIFGTKMGEEKVMITCGVNGKISSTTEKID